MVAQQSYPPTPPGHQRHLLAVPFETDLSFAEIVTAPDPYEEGVDEEERTRRHRLQQQQLADDHRRIGEAAAAIVEPMNGTHWHDTAICSATPSRPRKCLLSRDSPARPTSQNSTSPNSTSPKADGHRSSRSSASGQPGRRLDAGSPRVVAEYLGGPGSSWRRTVRTAGVVRSASGS